MRKSETNRNRLDFNRHVGCRLALRRKETGHSAAQLDKALCLTPGSVAAFENGRRTIGVAVAYFFNDAPVLHVKPLDGLPSPDKVADAERFIDAYFKVEDRDVRRDILGLMKAAGDGKNARRAG